MNGPIAHYHELLGNADLAEASHVMLEDQLRRQELVFGDRPLCTVLRPRFFTAEGLVALERQVREVMGGFERAYQAALADPSVLAQFRLTDWERVLVEAESWVATPSPTSRLDLFGAAGGGPMALTEYNAETPAGAGFNDALTTAFTVLPVMRAFRRRYAVRPVPARQGVANGLLDAWHDWSGRRSLPRIAIVDWENLPTRTEFVLFRDYFRGLGMDAFICDPRSLEYRGGRLHGAGGPVDVIYKRVLIHELVGECGLEGDMVRAVRNRAVCMVNPFRCKILHKKASLAVLSDERNAGLFGAGARRAIAAMVPWTRVVEERKTTWQGQPVDLLPFLEAHQEHLVLKPNDDYGGAGIVLGWTVPAEQWRAAIRTALATPYIVQDRVEIPSEPFPGMVEGKLVIYDRMYDTAPFVVNGGYVEGCLTRLSTAKLLNVTAGGGSTVPSFVVEER
jgi:hypothetical protein